MIVGGVWVVIVATAILIFRRRIVTLLLRLCVSDRTKVEQRRDLNIGIILLAVFAYGLVGILLVVPILPSPAIAWVVGFGIVIEFLVATLYWIRFANAGLSLTSWMGRQ